MHDKDLFRRLVSSAAISSSPHTKLDNHRRMRLVSSTNELLVNMRKLIILDYRPPTTMEVTGTHKRPHQYQTFAYLGSGGSGRPSSINRVSRRKQDLISQHIGLERALDALAASFLNRNDLIIIKTDVDTLMAILDAYAAIRRRHIFYPYSSSHTV